MLFSEFIECVCPDPRIEAFQQECREKKSMAQVNDYQLICSISSEDKACQPQITIDTFKTRNKRKYVARDNVSPFEQSPKKKSRLEIIQDQHNNRKFVPSKPPTNIDDSNKDLFVDSLPDCKKSKGYFRYIPSVTFEMDPVYSKNSESTKSCMPQDIPGCLVPLCTCADCNTDDYDRSEPIFNAKPSNISPVNPSGSIINNTLLNNKYCDLKKNDMEIRDRFEIEIDRNCRSLNDIIDSLSMSDFDDETFLNDQTSPSIEKCTNMKGTVHPHKHLVETVAYRTGQDDTSFGVKDTAKEAAVPSIPNNTFLPYNVEPASLSVPQPNILKHSTNPNNSFVSYVVEKQYSLAAQTMIETSELKQINPPKPLDGIVPTTLISTCGIITTSKVVQKGFSCHINSSMTDDSNYNYILQQNSAQELHTIYGSTCNKIYNLVR